MTKEKYLEAGRLLEKIEELENALMTYFNGDENSQVSFMVRTMGKTPSEAVETIKESLRQKYDEFKAL